MVCMLTMHYWNGLSSSASVVPVMFETGTKMKTIKVISVLQFQSIASIFSQYSGAISVQLFFLYLKKQIIYKP